MDFDFGRHRYDKGSDEDEEVWKILARLGGPLVRNAKDPFFEEGDRICDMKDPQVFETFDSEEFPHKDYKPFPCSEQGCSKVFAQLIDSEAHYNAVHRFPCSECKQGFISAHLLELHVLENHDAFFKVLSARKPYYSCFLEICKCKFKKKEDRSRHVIQDHGFDPNLEFFEPMIKKQEGNRETSPSRKKKARRPLSMALSSPSKEDKSKGRIGPTPAKSTNNLSPTKSTPLNLRPSKIPVRSFSYKNISFGSGITKTFDTSELNQRWYVSRFDSAKKKRSSMDIHNMEDVKMSLPSIK
uniref:Zinc finger protein 511 n=1 Tax=Lepeophtheirus salmonis TaxID=72036 RepID=C1BVR7_LEPSM|nr:Zinc finger protein 511 [Lepeophtheirus salmonis]